MTGLGQRSLQRHIIVEGSLPLGLGLGDLSKIVCGYSQGSSVIASIVDKLSSLGGRNLVWFIINLA
ncbi:MAG: hypothetical protein GDA43_11000 [Hormoscilla sp. SP5CHS1]|nr:hypothetical protein [Hormoscilla sp. SP12CHS1]MBC6453671.1 hypothetical protein [Hormoscilla sp. SP5CHS1]